MFKYGLTGLFGLAMAGVVGASVVGMGVVGMGIVGSKPALAQVCGEMYVVRAKDTLSKLSRTAYGKPNKWRMIYNANYKTIGTSPALILPGQSLVIPCRGAKAPLASKSPPKPDGTPTKEQLKLATQQALVAAGLAPAKTKASRLPTIRLLTASDYKPFTDQGLPNGGMLTDVVRTALEVQRKSVSGPEAKIVWVNDWAAHLDPLLSNKAFDLGFPWVKPDCARYDTLDKPAKFRCDTFFFSDPLFEILEVFFKKKGSPFKFDGDRDVDGSRLCRPSGYNTFDLDKDGRNWIKDKKVTLAQPQSVGSCFEMLERGEVDAVAVNEFVGRAAIKKLKMADRFEILDRPVSILNLHVIVAKTHKRAKQLLKYVNQGLARIRADGIYGEIVDRHLTKFWAGQESS